MLVYPYVRNRFLPYPSAFLLLLLLLSSACGYTRGLFDNTQSKNMDVGKAKESRNAASKINANPPRFGQHSEGSQRPNMLGSKQNAGIMTPETKLSGQTDGVQSELKGSLKKVILDDYTLREGIEREYRLYRSQRNFEVNSQDLTRTWSLKAASWAGNAEEVLQEIDFVAKEQFRVYHGPTVPRGGGDEKWGNIDNWLNDKLDFLGRFYEKLGQR